jgi:hypothetical protein
MKVFLTTAWPKSSQTTWNQGCLTSLRNSAALNISDHQLVSSPESADLILFADKGPLPVGLSILLHHCFIEYREKCFVYDEQDICNYWYRALNVSGSRFISSSNLHRGAAYIRTREISNQCQLSFPSQPKYLFSFVGSSETHSVRARLRKLYEKDGLFHHVSRSVTNMAFTTGNSNDIARLTSFLTQTSSESLFVLCPRGLGASSMRLFEVMSMGRAPVIISDEWMEPFGPNWSDFSIRIAECNIHTIPDVLYDYAPNAKAMGEAARRAWENWFSPDQHFSTLTETCHDLLSPSSAQAWSPKRLMHELLAPRGIRSILRYFRNTLKL